MIDVEKDVADHLQEANFTLESIDGVIWSHHHMDHIGDVSLFPPSTSLIVGPGFEMSKITFFGHQRYPDVSVVDDEFHGRNITELDFSANSLEIGGFPAIDFFGDGSFFLLHTKGHSKLHDQSMVGSVYILMTN
jgi:glyoxylase-like metal-dependent hydrolase (beta-lactamase superfamily II)